MMRSLFKINKLFPFLRNYGESISRLTSCMDREKSFESS